MLCLYLKSYPPLLTLKYSSDGAKDFLDAYYIMYFMLHAPGSDEGESNYPGRRDHVESSAGGRRPESVDHGAEEEDRRMEERKTKVLSILSKLQDDAPRQPNSNKGRSNFEDCEYNQRFLMPHHREYFQKW